MAKELPYFQFEPAEYMSGSIQFCSLAAQGLFINILSVYWQRSCNLTIEQVNKRFNQPDLLSELITENIIKVNDGVILIQFLYNQLNNVAEIAKKRGESGKKGMVKRWGSDNKPITNAITKPLQSDNKAITIREEKIREDKIRVKKRDTLPKNGQSNLHPLQRYIQENHPQVCKMKSQLTFSQSENLVTKFSKEEIKDVLNGMENKADLLKKYTSVNLTIQSWIKIRKSKSPEITTDKKYEKETDIYSEFQKY